MRGIVLPNESPTTSPTLKLLSLAALAVFVLQIGVLIQRLTAKQSTLQTSFRSERNTPIILVGLPRSGSSAIHDYFQCHGWSSVHYCCGGKSTSFPCLDEPTCGKCILKNMKNHQHPFEGCGPEKVLVWSQFDVETADKWFLPQHFALGLLHEAYPNATWILNTRGSSREWAESVFHWHSTTSRFFATYGLRLEPRHALTIPPPSPDDAVTAEEIESDMQLQLDARVRNRTEHLRKFVLLKRIYENHTATIYRWVHQFPSHPFLHVNVDEKSSLKLLDRAFQLDSDERRCGWTFRSPTDDWKDFTFPFES